ncbi:MAG: hypothetical protein WBE69_02395, partial [Candidatus Binataceae bacterium]
YQKLAENAANRSLEPYKSLIIGPPIFGGIFESKKVSSAQTAGGRIMKGTIATLVGTLMVGAALALPAVSFAQAPPVIVQERGGHFPAMHQAMEQLRHARQTLEADAAADFQGHKKNAIAHIDAALQELKLGMQAVRQEEHGH